MNSQQIKSMRLRLGLNQRELASVLGISRLAVVMWENGTRNPSQMAVNFIKHLIAEKERGTVDLAPSSPDRNVDTYIDSTPMDHAELRTLRDLAGWTQAEFARRLGITDNHYARIERGDPREGQVRPITLTIAILARLVAKLHTQKRS
jgi:transcriptional regulator with XRE-family HTH domain